MKKQGRFSDERVKKELFPLPIFLLFFGMFAVLTTLQMMIIGQVIDYHSLPAANVAGVLGFWAAASAAVTLITGFVIRRRYQKPIEEFSEAARRVAAGDFSVYLPPRHTIDKRTHLDVLFVDFNKMVEELGSIETLKTDFFSNVSHEIKTPLAVIQTNAELLQTGHLSEAQRRECTDTILQATRRLSNLITNMLKLNKLEKQVIQPMPQPYDLCAQLCACALQFEDQWERKHIEFDADLEDRATVCADEGLMELVWTNLLSNAIKFTPEGGRVTLRQTSGPDGITVAVSDTGCGMDPGTMAKIFDKFYQGDTSHATEGNGLGLALVQRILELSDGTVSVTSTPGKGSTFTVRLPLPHEEVPA